MPLLVPARFLVRVCHPCPYVAGLPADAPLCPVPEAGRLLTLAALDGRTDFADVRLGWNETGLGLWASVTGKRKPPEADADRPRTGDGLTLWLDTRGDRTAHRASRFGHQFHLLPTGGGPDKDQPAFLQAKVNRAQQDAPLCSPADVAFRCTRRADGYALELFLPAAVLSGFDPDQHPRLGVNYHVHDAELGDQYLAAGADFPVADDPSLWEPLELTGGPATASAS
jgi:hypothetical protein